MGAPGFKFTHPCWLCLSDWPPFYEGLAVVGNMSNQSTHNQCHWQHLGMARLTVPSVSRQGLCIGTVPAQYRPLCNQTITNTSTYEHLVPPNGTWWACQTGLTPCARGRVLFYNSSDFLRSDYIAPKNHLSGRNTPLRFSWSIVKNQTRTRNCCHLGCPNGLTPRRSRYKNP